MYYTKRRSVQDKKKKKSKIVSVTQIYTPCFEDTFRMLCLTRRFIYWNIPILCPQ